jgi:hypothetical protein
MNKKLIFVSIGFIILSTFYVNNENIITSTIKNILEWKHLNLILWLYIILCFLIYYLSVKDMENYESGLIFKEFGTFGNSAFAIITYGLALTTSASILKGVYIQQYFKDKVYFNNFDEIDIYSMLVVSIFLFGYSILNSFKSFIGAIMLNKGEDVTPR